MTTNDMAAGELGASRAARKLVAQLLQRTGALHDDLAQAAYGLDEDGTQTPSEMLAAASESVLQACNVMEALLGLPVSRRPAELPHESKGGSDGQVFRIEWCDHSFSPWTGCQHITEGCDHCYAESWGKRTGHVGWGAHAARRLSAASTWKDVPKWPAVIDGRRARIFSAELADIFDNQADPAWRVCFWTLVRATPQFDWLILTKRIENAARMLPADWGDGWRHVWLGITAETQEHYDRRWPILARTSAAVRFISYEPALGPLSITRHATLPDWIIAGYESGPGARPCDEDWIRRVRDECVKSGVAFFYKQRVERGRKIPLPEIDGRRWEEYPCRVAA